MSGNPSFFWDENRKPNFNMHPVTTIPDTVSFKGAGKIVDELKKAIKEKGGKVVIVFNYYYGINEEKFYQDVVSKIGADLEISSEEAHYPETVIWQKYGKNITEDRILGVYVTDHIDECFDPEILARQRKQIEECTGVVAVYGTAAAVVCEGDILVYCDISKKEVGARQIKGQPNWGAGNEKEEPLKKQKRSTFFEDRMLDWQKTALFKTMNFYVDCNKDDAPVMLSAETFHYVTKYMETRPIQNIASFTPAVWGGHWAQKVLGADPTAVNIGWATPGSLERLDVIFNVGGNEVRMIAQNLILDNPAGIIGQIQWSNLGYKAPVIANYLDTWQGGNLSLQVHPTVSYSHEVFNSDYGHHESYYMMDVMDDSSVYLGMKEEADFDEMIAAMKEAQETGKFDDTKYINRIPMKKHDHIYIPGGTIHASGENTVVLEIDIFGVQTFKLWDWGRIDFDGKPRPINIGHGEKVIQPQYKTEFVMDNLVSKRQEVDRGFGWRKEFSGTTPYERFAVYRYWVKNSLMLETDGVVKLYVLVEGEEAVIESPNGFFEPYVIHYAEAVFIPAAAGQVIFKPYGKSAGKEIALVETYMDFKIR